MEKADKSFKGDRSIRGGKMSPLRRSSEAKSAALGNLPSREIASAPSLGSKDASLRHLEVLIPELEPKSEQGSPDSGQSGSGVAVAGSGDEAV